MSPAGRIDVVVIGFGIAGATAACEAARAGARVLVLDGRGSSARLHSTLGILDRFPGLRTPFGRLPKGPRARVWSARAAALAAGAMVYTPAKVCELHVDGGRVCGVGYSALENSSVPVLAHSCLTRLAERLGGRLESLGHAVGERAEAVWERASTVESSMCSSVVLAIDPEHWEFVGSAAWASLRAAEREVTCRGRPTPHPALSAGGVAVDVPPFATKELLVRLWCASQAGGMRAAGRQALLRVGQETGEVLIGEGHKVPGLYSAVLDEHAETGASETEAASRKAAAGRRAGLAAANCARELQPQLDAWPGDRSGDAPWPLARATSYQVSRTACCDPSSPTAGFSSDSDVWRGVGASSTRRGPGAMVHSSSMRLRRASRRRA